MYIILSRLASFHFKKDISLKSIILVIKTIEYLDGMDLIRSSTTLCHTIIYNNKLVKHYQVKHFTSQYNTAHYTPQYNIIYYPVQRYNNQYNTAR